jgi:hypothetical protein
MIAAFPLALVALLVLWVLGHVADSRSMGPRSA